MAAAIAGVGLVVALGCHALFTPDSDPVERSFAHAFHFKAIKNVKCVDCHKPVAPPQAGGAPPGKYMGILDMAICSRCHDPRRSPDLKVRTERFVEPRVVSPFDHGKHAAHTPTDCRTCHTAVETSVRASDRLTPKMETCWNCHAKLTTLAGEKGARCSLCHAPDDDRHAPPEKAAVFRDVIAKNTPVAEIPSEVMPAAHAKLLGRLWLGELSEDQIPPDHTDPFRRTTHGRLSRAPAAKCYACHETAQCNECHEGMRPPSHTPRFERSTHGREAALRREACAACHQADFCESCHEIAPPGHTPDFRRGAHARTARVSTRSCLACHSFDADCARCHNR